MHNNISSCIHCHCMDYSLRRLLMSRQFVAFLKECNGSYIAPWTQLTYTMLWLSRPRESPWRNPMKKLLRWNDTEGCLVSLWVVFANSVAVIDSWPGAVRRSCSLSVASSPAVDGKVGIHFVHRLRGQTAHDYHVTECADTRIRAPKWTYMQCTGYAWKYV